MNSYRINQETDKSGNSLYYIQKLYFCIFWWYLTKPTGWYYYCKQLHERIEFKSREEAIAYLKLSEYFWELKKGKTKNV